MIINRLAARQRPIIVGVMPFLLLLLLEVPVFGQDKSGGAVQGTNIRWSTQGDIIVINYDLNGPADEKYEVDVVMKKETDPSFVAIPRTMEGDIGEGFFAGTGREIRWYYRRDYPQGFEGEGFYFEIHVKPMIERSNTLYYALGAAAVAGGLLVYLLTRNQNTTVPSSELPMPPSRP